MTQPEDVAVSTDDPLGTVIANGLIARYEKAEALRDILLAGLREIAEQDPVDLILDPEISRRLARAIIAHVEDGE